MVATMTRAQMEARRLKGIELLRSGWSQADVSRELGVTDAAVCQWNRVWKCEGKRALRAKPHSGRPPKLQSAQKLRLEELLERGALASGFETDDWTCPRVQQLIAKEFGVDYHVDHLSRLLRDLGFTPQRPKMRSNRRDEKAIRNWRRREWPRIKKGA
jgi:transposase